MQKLQHFPCRNKTLTNLILFILNIKICQKYVNRLVKCSAIFVKECAAVKPMVKPMKKVFDVSSSLK